MSEVLVKSCKRCPFAVYREEVSGLTCEHPEVAPPSNRQNYVEGKRKPPAWCPLRKGSILVKLEVP